jgi:hypothetical protein
LRTTDHVPLGQVKTKAPELQIHCAATLIAHGDPFSKDPDKRMDKAGEIAQFCVPIDSKFVGKLKLHHIDEAFFKLRESILHKLRQHGVMASGE